jgi:hypothetical protein
MGLDMFAYSVPKEYALTPFSYVQKKSTEIHYWRRHNSLHVWMENLWKDKKHKLNGYIDKSEIFNIQPLELTAGDLDRLEKDIKNNRLSRTNKFSLIEEAPDTESVIDDLTFVYKAREELNKGNFIYYNSCK